ncbi:STAS domain-containing protein [Sporosarcina sp. PTS2304]|uniref:RsbT co-antagonist protein RsbRA n=1 Tax=Sporosarcina sp. PTS2304 TaxID=2283194 RepID=UPI000E0D7E85|nr:RsbT co-antagonist protein RsbRA [Sporosarcina sp. PTS2304]AXI00281.1 STAS domain-containing protein [Sporosarcina sp. PTS2304]
MNEVMRKAISDNIETITSRWLEKMKGNSDERFLDLMPATVVATTSREFTELMTSNLADREKVDEERLDEFTEKIIHFGWSIKFINRAIDTFSSVVYELFFEIGVLTEQNLRKGVSIFANWINPLRESIIEEYSVKWERTDSLQKIALQELSASLIPVFEKISVMPLVGTIDTERAKLIMENLLEGVVKQRAEVVLLDITGVPVVDTMVAHHIIQAADAVRLVGAKCMLVGIRPEIAQTIVTLGINLTDFSTTSTLRRGMQKALQMTGRIIVEEE